MYGALLALALLAADAGPSPSPSPSPTATPYPRPTPPAMAVVPSLGFGGYVGENAHGNTVGGTHAWAGAMFHPAPTELEPFMGLGLSLDGTGADTWRGMPEFRYGVAWLTEPQRYLGAVFPGFTAYAIGGWRPERGSSGLFRVGGGLSSPMLLAYMSVEHCVPFPSMVEVVVDGSDGDFSGKESRASLRAGWQF